ncbi:MAG: PAS domain-containing sensor histidine kinase [Ignavibacteriaceae bacterium]|nr:PAS domain-containing sensor histidine kinase [Ignavibacteriaceae bacterium]
MEDKELTELLSILPDVIFIHKNGIIIYANESACQGTGYQRSELIGKNVLDFVAEEEREKIVRNMELRRKGEESSNLKSNLISKSGELRTHSISTLNILYDGEKAVLFILNDITERLKAEEKLKESEEKYRLLIHFASDPIFSINPDETYRFVNEAFGRRVNLTPAEIIGKTPYDLYPREEAEKRLKVIRKVFLTGNAGEREVEYIKGNGEHEYYITKVDPIKDESGKVIWAACISTNLTALKKAENALGESKINYKRVVDNVKDVIFETDAQGLWKFLNPAWEEITGFSVDESIGKLFLDYVHPEDRIRNMELFAPLINREKSYCRHEIRYLTKNGGYCWIEVFARLGLNDKDEVTGTYGTLRDITTIKNAELVIRNKNEELIKINAEKDKMFSIISHDLKSPFLGLLGLSKAMTEDDIPFDDYRELSRNLNDSAIRVYTLIENLLEWSLIQRGLKTFNPCTIELLSAIRENIETFSAVANKKEIDIKADIPSSIHINADQEMFNSILRNLLSNALKFSKRGDKIKISALQSDSNMVQVSIKDTGVGIKKDMLEKLFKAGERTSRMGTEGELSSGLGLLLCKEFVEKNGGKIWVESEPGAGSIFYFTLFQG